MLSICVTVARQAMGDCFSDGEILENTCPRAGLGPGGGLAAAGSVIGYNS